MANKPKVTFLGKNIPGKVKIWKRNVTQSEMCDAVLICNGCEQCLYYVENEKEFKIWMINQRLTT